MAANVLKSAGSELSRNYGPNAFCASVPPFKVGFP